MENLRIILYGLIQGITEFLPISSSAHLLIIGEFFEWEEKGLLLALGAHLGTLLAVIFSQKKTLVFFNSSNIFKKFSINSLFLSALIACLPVIFIGGLITLLSSNSYQNNLLIIAIASILGGLLLEISDNYNKKDKNRKSINYKQAMIIGCFQTLALIPGMSRSGTIITAMRFLGMEREFSIKFSLLTSIPVLLLACSYSVYQVLMNYQIFIFKFLIIVIISFITALISINFFLLWVNKFSFRIFSIYRVLLGLLIIIYLSLN
jgi:undecaprenyl-diphosphatase